MKDCFVWYYPRCPLCPLVSVVATVYGLFVVTVRLVERYLVATVPVEVSGSSQNLHLAVLGQALSLLQALSAPNDPLHPSGEEPDPRGEALHPAEEALDPPGEAVDPLEEALDPPGEVGYLPGSEGDLRGEVVDPQSTPGGSPESSRGLRRT